MARKSFLAGFAAGAAAVYLLDPAHGKRRRARVRSRVEQLRAEFSAGGLGGIGTLIRPGAESALRTRRGDIDGLDAHRLRTGEAAPGRLSGSAAAFGVAGGALALYGVARRGPLGGAMRSVGGSLLAAGLRDLERLPSGLLRERRRTVEAQRSIDVAATPAAAYGFWRNWENLSRLLSHATRVEDLGAGKSRWTMDGPAGAPVIWTANLTGDQPGHFLAWESDADSPVQHVGTIRFSPSGSGTRIDARIAYTPGPGAPAMRQPGLLGADPALRLHDDLGRLKAMLTAEGEN